MKVVITGMPQSGQQQLFAILSGVSLDTIAQKPHEIHKGVCDVRDGRITRLTEMYKPKKITFTKIEYILLPDFNLQGPAKMLLYNELRNAEEICWVSSAASAMEEIDSFMSELVINDLILVEKRLETIEKEIKKKANPEREKEKELMLKCKNLLEENKLIKDLVLASDDAKSMPTYQFLSQKPVVFAVNTEDGKPDAKIAEEIKKKYNSEIVFMSAEIEEEISRLPESEKAEFMKELGIDEPAVDKMTGMVYNGLGLISFFTVGEDEVRAWPVRKGASAVEAAGKVHSDIAKGFVRAELMKYKELIEAGSEAKLKDTGKYYLKGKEYIVEDGDILHYRFNI